MTGEELYALYVQAHDEQSVGVDSWNDLPVDDWHVWNRIAQLTGSPEGHPWSDFLHHRARAIDLLYSGDGSDSCKGDDAAIAKTLSMDPMQVMLIRTRDRSLS